MIPGRELCHAYVLHARAYKEKSRLLEIWTLEHGRFSAVGRDAVPLFQPCLVTWRGRGALKTLATCEQAGLPRELTGDALFAGFYLNELMVRLLPPEEPQPLLFAFYGEVLEGLHDPDRLEPLLRRFEMQLLAVIGYELDFRRDADGEPVLPDVRYDYRSREGLVPVATGWPGTDLLAIAVDDYREPSARRVAKHILRNALGEHLGAHPLKSRELWLRSKS